MKIALRDGKALLTGVGSSTNTLTSVVVVMQTDRYGGLLGYSAVHDTGAEDNTRCGVRQVP